MLNNLFKSKKMVPALVISTTNIIVILIVVLLLFGGKKIPELMKGLGQGVKEFKDASKPSEEKKEEEKK